MDSKEVAPWIWQLAPGHYTGTEAQVLLAVLACNLAGHAPTAREVEDHIEPPKSSGRAARKSLVERTPPALVTFRDRYALCRFRHLLPGPHTMPGTNKVLPLSQEKTSADVSENAAENPATRAKNTARNDDFSPVSRAVVAVDLKDKSNGGGALNAPLEALQLFAENVLGMKNAAAAVELAFNRFGSDVLVSALEQFHYCYTARRREAANPPGQLLAWCKQPAKMDRLPPGALKVSAWLERRAARVSAPRIEPVRFVSLGALDREKKAGLTGSNGQS